MDVQLEWWDDAGNHYVLIDGEWENARTLEYNLATDRWELPIPTLVKRLMEA